MAKRKFEVTVQYSFAGTYTVLAENENEAHNAITNDSGMIAGKIFSHNKDVLNWTFPDTPDESIQSILVKECESPKSVEINMLESAKQIFGVADLIDDGVRFPSKDSKAYWFKKSSSHSTDVLWVILTDGGGGYTASEISFDGDRTIAKGHLSDLLKSNDINGKKLAELNIN
jgi:hypothetical protein